MFSRYDVFSCHDSLAFLDDARASVAMALDIDSPHEVVSSNVVSRYLLHIILVAIQQLSTR